MRMTGTTSSCYGFKIPFWFALLLAITSIGAAQEVRRPQITGFSHVAFYTTAPDAARHLYVDLLGLEPGDQSSIYLVGHQAVEAVAQKPPDPPSFLSNIAFATTDAEQMRRYLQAHGVTIPSSVNKEENGRSWFEVKDPEGNRIQFV